MMKGLDGKELDETGQQYTLFSLMLVKTMILTINCEELFTARQVDAMATVVNECEEANTDKENYLRHFDLLEEHRLEMNPALDD